MRYISVVVLLLVVAACGGSEEFSVPADKEEALALLDTKKREIRELNTQVAELERATGGGNAEALNSKLVRARTVANVDFAREIELQATVESDETAVVTVEVPGRVNAVLVEEGQAVQRGQVLVRIDLESVDMQLAELATNLSLAEDILARQQRLRDQQIGTEIQFLEAQNAVDRLVKAREQLQLQAAKSSVTAPISGTVESKAVNPGEYAAPGQPLMQILDARNVQVVADVPETYLRSVKKGQQVRVKFPALNLERTAKVTELGRTIDAANRTFRVELDMRNADRLLKPNMLANVYLIDYENADVVAVPVETVLEEIDGREYVYVARQADDLPEGTYRAEKAYVTAGESDALRREITGGLIPGDVLVTDGMRSLTEGQAIRLQLQDDTTDSTAATTPGR